MHSATQLYFRLCSFLRCRRANAAVEFAFAAPVFILGLVGIIEISLILFVSVLAEGGLREASRYGITGQNPGSITREEQIVEIIKEHTHGLIDASPSNITFKVYGSFDYIGKPEPFEDDDGDGEYDDGEEFTDLNGNASWDEDPGEPGVGGAGEIVLYEFTYQWEFLTPLFQVFGGDDGKLDLSAAIAVRNEPYDPSGDET